MSHRNSSFAQNTRGMESSGCVRILDSGRKIIPKNTDLNAAGIGIGGQPRPNPQWCSQVSMRKKGPPALVAPIESATKYLTAHGHENTRELAHKSSTVSPLTLERVCAPAAESPQERSKLWAPLHREQSPNFADVELFFCGSFSVGESAGAVAICYLRLEFTVTVDINVNQRTRWWTRKSLSGLRKKIDTTLLLFLTHRVSISRWGKLRTHRGHLRLIPTSK